MELMEQSCLLAFTDPSRPKYCRGCGKIHATDSFCQKCRILPEPQVCSVESRKGLYVNILKGAQLQPVGLWAEIANKSIIEIAQCVSNAARAASNSHSCAGSGKGCPLVSSMWSLKTEIDGPGGVETLIRGLCLDCIKAGRETSSLAMEQLDKGICRVAHGSSHSVA